MEREYNGYNDKISAVNGGWDPGDGTGWGFEELESGEDEIQEDPDVRLPQEAEEESNSSTESELSSSEEGIQASQNTIIAN